MQKSTTQQRTKKTRKKSTSAVNALTKLSEKTIKKPFDYTKSIDRREYLDDLSGYKAFIINKALSLSVDTLFYANEMNLNSHLDNKMQYDFLYHSIRPVKNRPFKQWLYDAKKEEDEAAIMEYFGYNSQKAKQILSILQPEQIRTIKERLVKGGT